MQKLYTIFIIFTDNILLCKLEILEIRLTKPFSNVSSFLSYAGFYTLALQGVLRHL